MGPRGDAIVEADWCIGELLKTLETEDLLDHTLIIFSSDNGPVLNDGYYDQAVEQLGSHQPAGQLRGGKYSLFEAGTRVPFVTWWPGTIAPGKSDALVSQLDLFASLAALVGLEEKTAGKDSQDLLEALLGQSQQGRDDLVLEASTRTAYRQGEWVLIPPYDGPAINQWVNIELGNLPDYGLYNLTQDIGQQENLAASHPDKLAELMAAFAKIRGLQQTNSDALELK